MMQLLIDPEICQVLLHPTSDDSNVTIKNRQKLNQTAGAGACIVFNKDNVISINYGIPFSRHDGHGGLYVRSSLLF
jgi:hypothetical protein